MEIDYIRESGVCYLRIISDNDHLIRNRMRMITLNRMEGMANVTCRNVNNREQYLYNISSTMPLTQCFEKTEMKKEDVLRLAEGIKKGVHTLERYLLDVNGLILNPDYIFYDSSKNEYRFCYYAGNKVGTEDGMKALFEYVIEHVCHGDAKAVTLAYGIYKRICIGNVDIDHLTDTEESEEVKKPEVVEEYIPVDNFIPEISKEEHEEKDIVKIYCIYGAGAILALIFIYSLAGIFIKGVRIKGISGAVYILICVAAGICIYMGYKWYEKNKDLLVKTVTSVSSEPYQKKKVRIIVPESIPENREELYTVVLNGREEKNKGVHCLKWVDAKGSHSYEVRQDACVIGSAADRADCCILLPGVSRVHARITKEGDTYYIKDMNSTNGTRVNDRELGCFELCEISSGDNILIGDAECVFV